MKSHPAKMGAAILKVITERLPHGVPLVLDPFGGTGQTHLLPASTVVIELEWEWAKQAHRLASTLSDGPPLPLAPHPQPLGTLQADALHLPFRKDSFEVVATSPTYGNRYADHHEARDTSTRRSYRHDLGRPLRPTNSGGMQWGQRYRDFHTAAWAEATRVLAPGGLMILNCKDHIRGGIVIRVTDWHVSALEQLGLTVDERIRIEAPGLRYGSSATARQSHEEVVVLTCP